MPKLLIRILSLYCLGLFVLLGAIFLNFISSYLGLMNWFDFLQKTNPINEVVLIDAIWLFIIYPTCLGLLTLALATVFKSKLKKT